MLGHWPHPPDTRGGDLEGRRGRPRAQTQPREPVQRQVRQRLRDRPGSEYGHRVERGEYRFTALREPTLAAQSRTMAVKPELTNYLSSRSCTHTHTHISKTRAFEKARKQIQTYIVSVGEDCGRECIIFSPMKPKEFIQLGRLLTDCVARYPLASKAINWLCNC